MSVASRLTQVWNSAPVLVIHDQSRIVLFSDCHRGDGGASDDFARNEATYLHALSVYDQKRFTYIELGDGDELWENSNFSAVAHAHPKVFAQLHRFYADGRLYMLYGNHDIERESMDIVQRTLWRYIDAIAGEPEPAPLFDGLIVHEGLRLRYESPNQPARELFLTHGHQGDWLNDRLWREGRFLVRYLWRPLQRLGIKDPTRTSKSLKKQIKVTGKIADWAQANQQPIIVGHTHQESFAAEGELAYFNTGCCIYPDCITAIEIENGALSFVRWSENKNDVAEPKFTRVVEAGPRAISTVR